MNLFLVTGPRRTGTTLLYSVLCSDPAANPLLAEAQILTRMIEAYRWGRQHFTLFGKSFFDDPEDYRSYYAGVVGTFIDRARVRFAPATTLILKNPEFALVVDDLLQLLPQAKLIVTIRDPRDQVVSELETGQRQIARGLPNPAAATRDIAALSRTLLAYCDPVLRAVQAVPERFEFVRFEDLLLRTDETLARLRKITGLTFSQFDPTAQWSRVALDWNDYRAVPAVTPQYGQKFDASRVKRFSSVLTATEVAVVEDICRLIMQRFNY